MALKATIYKAKLDIADMDRNYYSSRHLTIALHPSETEQRLMARILSFAAYASDELCFTRGLSTEDEPDLWEKDLTGAIIQWIDLGTPDENRVRKGCNRADRMVIVVYDDRSGHVWWEKHKFKLQRFENLEVVYFPEEQIDQLAESITRTMDFQVNIQDEQMWVVLGGKSFAVTPERWK